MNYVGDHGQTPTGDRSRRQQRVGPHDVARRTGDSRRATVALGTWARGLRVALLEPSWTIGAVRIFEVTISDETIRLGQFLILADLALGESDAKVMLEVGWVTVNGRVEVQLGRQLRPGDLVAAAGRSVRVVTADQGEPRAAGSSEHVTADGCPGAATGGSNAASGW